MVTIGITGQSGFVGTHLYNVLSSQPNKYKCIPFKDSFWSEETELHSFVKQCDVIVHLAAMMRSPLKGMVYETNMKLVNRIIEACEKENVFPVFFFASSIQENNGSEYAKCKLDGKARFVDWAKMNKSGFGCMIFPNLFGPLARPNSHSFIATFCYKLTHGELPQILVDNNVSLKYIVSMIKEMVPFMDRVIKNRSIEQLEFKPDYILKVSDVLNILNKFVRAEKDGEIPVLLTQADKDLYNTYVEYKKYTI